MTRRQTPQIRKARDLTKRVDMFGENQKSSRRNISRRRASIERVYRHAVKAELARGEEAEPAAVRRRRWKKWATPTLGEALQHKAVTREANQIEPLVSAETRSRRAERRKGTRR